MKDESRSRSVARQATSAGRALLLLGANGFVGRHLRAAAETAGLRVTGTATRPGEAELVCDLRDADSVAAAVAASEPDLVINMAGSPSVAASWDEPDETFAVNAAGVQNLLDAVTASAPAAHVLCVSSAEVYGEVSEEELPLTEDHPLRPVSPYGRSKAAMEELCERYAGLRGLRIGVVRAFNQIGPGQSPQFVTSSFARQIAEAEVEGANELKMRVGNLSASRDFTDVRDSARAFLGVSDHELTDTLNMCSGTAVSIETLVKEMQKVTTLDVTIERDPALFRPVDTPTIYGSASRLRSELGWEPAIPTKQSIADLIEWWRVELRADRGHDGQ